MSDAKSFYRIYIHGPHRNHNPALRLTQVVYQVYGLCADALQTTAPSHVPAILQDVNLSLQRSAQALLLAEVDSKRWRWTWIGIP